MILAGLRLDIAVCEVHAVVLAPTKRLPKEPCDVVSQCHICWNFLDSQSCGCAIRSFRYSNPRSFGWRFFCCASFILSAGCRFRPKLLVSHFSTSCPLNSLSSPSYPDETV